jgi:hypothetical protein
MAWLLFDAPAMLTIELFLNRRTEDESKLGSEASLRTGEASITGPILVAPNFCAKPAVGKMYTAPQFAFIIK